MRLDPQDRANEELDPGNVDAAALRDLHILVKQGPVALQSLRLVNGVRRVARTLGDHQRGCLLESKVPVSDARPPDDVGVARLQRRGPHNTPLAAHLRKATTVGLAWHRRLVISRPAPRRKKSSSTAQVRSVNRDSNRHSNRRSKVFARLAAKTTYAPLTLKKEAS